LCVYKSTFLFLGLSRTMGTRIYSMGRKEFKKKKKEIIFF
jgi:hypothetical protein